MKDEYYRKVVLNGDPERLPKEDGEYIVHLKMGKGKDSFYTVIEANWETFKQHIKTIDWYLIPSDPLADYKALVEKVVNDEPEMPGNIPEILLMSFKIGTTEYIEETLRSIVRLTKKGILDRFESEITALENKINEEE
jgi:hypothetical protein